MAEIIDTIEFVTLGPILLDIISPEKDFCRYADAIHEFLIKHHKKFPDEFEEIHWTLLLED